MVLFSKKPVFFSFWCSLSCPWSEFRCVNGRAHASSCVCARARVRTYSLSQGQLHCLLLLFFLWRAEQRFGSGVHLIRERLLLSGDAFGERASTTSPSPRAVCVCLFFFLSYIFWLSEMYEDMNNVTHPDLWLEWKNSVWIKRGALSMVYLRIYSHFLRWKDKFT